MMQGQYNLQLVQAICVVVYWKHPRDKTFYQKLGVASRLICELRYAWPADLSRQPPVASEDEERRRVDIERTVHSKECCPLLLTADVNGLPKIMIMLNSRFGPCLLLPPPTTSLSSTMDA